MKKNVIKLLTTATLSATLLGAFSVGENNFKPQNVQAATKSYKVKLTHNAYIYNYRGRRVIRKVLKKNKVCTAYGIKKIGRKRYFKIGRNRYIKTGNARRYRHGKSKVLFSIVTNPGSDIYTRPNGSLSNWSLEGKQNVYQVEKVNGQSWYRLGTNKWIKASDTNKPDSSSTSQTQASNDKDTSNTTQISNDANINSSSSVQTQTKISAPNESSKTDRGIKKLSQQEENKIKEIFVQKVNNWREAQGLKPYRITSSMNEGSQLRADESISIFIQTHHVSHTRPNGQDFWTAFADPNSANGEITAWYNYQDDTVEELADEAFEDFVYHDADSNWGHRKELAWNYQNPIIGVGVTSVVTQGSAYMIIYADMGNGTN